MRLLALFLVLAVAVLVPFLIWGDWWEAAFSATGSRTWLEQLGPWAWAAGILLLVGDLFLPVPGTLIMSALGWIYGPLVGGLFAAAGSFLSGSIAYLMCSRIGEKAALKILGERDLVRGKRLFANGGGWIIALSRCLPILPEVTTCMAGLTKMPKGPFFISLACGSLPVGMVFAWIGAAGQENTGLAMGLSIALPVALWALASLVVKRRECSEIAK
jgi:uncharacterized membrane protein YdjX (TVP38/TMEM64 family)